MNLCELKLWELPGGSTCLLLCCIIVTCLFIRRAWVALSIMIVTCIIEQGEPLVWHYLSDTWFLQKWRMILQVQLVSHIRQVTPQRTKTRPQRTSSVRQSSATQGPRAAARAHRAGPRAARQAPAEGQEGIRNRSEPAESNRTGPSHDAYEKRSPNRVEQGWLNKLPNRTEPINFRKVRSRNESNPTGSFLEGAAADGKCNNIQQKDNKHTAIFVNK